MNLRTASIIALLGIGASGCSFAPQEPSDETRPQHRSSGAISKLTGKAGPTGAMHWRHTPPMTIDESASYVATIRTRQGDIVVTLLPKNAPIAVNNFVFLARAGYYRGGSFHRIAKGFVIQGGDPLGNGTGGPGYTIPDEPTDIDYDRGVVAMARSSEPDSAGSQFFIAQRDLDEALPTDDFAVFGRVKAGMRVVDRIANLTPVRPNDQGELSVPVRRVPIIDIFIDGPPPKGN